MKRSSIHEEVCALMWQDIDFERNLFEIRRSMTMAGGQLLIDEPKTKSSYRKEAMNDDVRELLLKLRDRQEENKRIPVADLPLSKPSSLSAKDKLPPASEQRREWRVQKTQRQFEKWRTRSIDLLKSYYAILDEQERACIRRKSEAADRKALDRITERKAVIQFYLNTLQSGTLDNQIDLYLYGREVITRIERRLEKHQQGEAGQAVCGDGARGLCPGATAPEREGKGHADH